MKPNFKIVEKRVIQSPFRMLPIFQCLAVDREDPDAAVACAADLWDMSWWHNKGRRRKLMRKVKRGIKNYYRYKMKG
jgi:hypothetical protein